MDPLPVDNMSEQILCHYVHVVVLTPGVMMEEQEPFHSALSGQPRHRPNIGVSPTSPDFHLFGQILTIVDEKVSALAKLREVFEAAPLPAFFQELVVAEKDEFFDPSVTLNPTPP